MSAYRFVFDDSCYFFSKEEQKDIDQHKPPCVIMNCQDSEESEDEEGISYEELKGRKGYKLLLKYLNGTSTNCN